MRTPLPVPSRRSRRVRRGATLALAVTLLAASCSGGSDKKGSSANGSYSGAESDQISEQGDPVTGGSIVVALEAETNSLLPGTGSFAESGWNVGLAIFDPLMVRDAEGELKPYLAESMTPSDDLSEWTLKLREGVTFHDGTALDAEAIKTIFDDFLTAETANTAASLAEVEEVTVDDPLTVTYHLAGPNSAFPGLLTSAAGWPFSPTAAKAAGEDAGAKPVGTGPFKLDSWQRDHELVVSRNDDYWQDGLPYLDKITFRPIPDEDTRRDSLQAGTVQAAITLRQSAVAQYREMDGVDNYEALSNASGGNIINTTRPPFDDLRVRKALVHAIDQDELIDVLGGAGITPPSSQLFSPEDPFYSEKVKAAYPGFDADAATALLDEYVNDPERSDGKAPGTKITVHYDCPPDPSLNELSQLYQAQWQGVGFEVELRQVEQSTHVSEALAKNYDVKCFRFGSSLDPWQVLDDAFTEGPLNFTGLQSPTIEEQLEIMKGTTDVAKRKAAAEVIGVEVNENAPLTYSGSTLTDIAVKDSVKNVAGMTFPNGDPGPGLTNAITFWGFAWLAE